MTIVGLVGRLQLKHLAALQALQPNRPILVQTDVKVARWVPWTEVAADQDLWTRSVLLNEVLFDVDAKPWRAVALAMARLVRVLDELHVPYYAGPSGGKGAHASVFLDPESIKVPDRLLERARKVDVDVWSEARQAFAHAVFDAMDLPRGANDEETENLRWAPPLGVSGVFDRSKVKWSAARSGSMVRAIGTPGGAGFRKTLAPEWHEAEWLLSATRDAEPPALPLKWHQEPALFAVPAALNQAIVARLEATVGKAEAARARERPTANSIQALGKVKSVPCIARILAEPAPRGTRHYAFLNLAATCKTLGVTRTGAENLLRQALALCGLDESDNAWSVLQGVYDGQYSLMNVCCPSPHVKAWCAPNACPLSRRFEFK